MKRPLLDVIFASEKRKNVLFLLQEGPQEMESLLKSLDTTRHSLLPQVRILEEHHLVDHSQDSYELTITGKLMIDRMNPLVGTIDLFDTDVDYWGSHDFGFIPPPLLNWLHEIIPCEVVSNTSPTEVYNPNKNVVEKAKHSKLQNSVTTFLFPNFASILADFNKNGVKMCLIVSEELLSKIKNEMEEVKNLLNNGLNEVFLYPKEMNFASFGTNDFCFMMRTLTKKGDYDLKYLMACNTSAIKWGNELFEYYLKDSIPINKV
ncbi:helix-turn-helix transcriptional regulator [Methanolobus halotolerans]|uniref:Transcriptional regulator n=1 Tax=Methanolobus halotolerans TaxID=2052935 RepID=A0A4E0PWF9_9EURY|nr:winged helix-turn-helix domain-containing protein [Methanolobus halotolerans]TGC08897.1 transcriptional regulator [Methanolobus halotolerans]